MNDCTERNFNEFKGRMKINLSREHLTFTSIYEIEYMFLWIYQSDFFTYSGGLKAVMYTDTFQTVIMTLGSFALVGISKSTLQWISIFKNGVKFGYSLCNYIWSFIISAVL